MKNFSSISLFCLTLAIPGFSTAAFAATPEAMPVETLDAGLIAAMKAGSAGADFAARAKALTPVVAQSYDLAVVTQNSVGFLWATLPAAQQQELTTLIGAFTVASYASQFSSYDGAQFTVSPTEKPLGQGYIILTKLTPGGGGDPVELDYAVKKSASGWGITDVLLNGTISQVALHESDFAALVTAGDASKLIAALKAKIAAIQSNTAS
ncbi:ABC transporter substrate-binding protein [Acidocella sp.]|uniref:ABC transporter substrate-binding protein n=1 Tax=Acidocella sp. TaxID=50710 RepID=UPI002636A8F0|nr:ABC transporter substrate-binding protein [Acidocella sp.]